MTRSSPNSQYRGGCFCGAVTYLVVGIPLLSAYCHCTLCQRLNASPFIHTIHFPDTAFAWTHAEPHETTLDSFTVPEKPWKTRWRCKQCGCCVSSHNSKAHKRSVWGTQLERDDEGKIKGWDELKPTAHMFYGTRLVDVDDGLGRWEGYEHQSTKLCE